MNLAIVGTGYVGLVTGACFAEMGNAVVCIDVDRDKIDALEQGVIPIYEPGLEAIVNANHRAGRLTFSSSLSAVLAKAEVEILFIAVGTPPDEDGSADLSHVLAVAREIGRHLNHPAIIANKSTVPVGTAERVSQTIQQELTRRGVEVDFTTVSNPEFLKEGAAVEDFMRPDRIIVGTDCPKARDAMQTLYAPFNRSHQRVLFMGVRDAELTKYAANAMLATKISFMNEMARLCEELAVDVENVRLGIGSDTRIGYAFIYPGSGYGGSCFPKDVKALIHMARQRDLDPEVLQAVESRNQQQKRRLLEKITGRFGEDLRHRRFALWGLAFKPGTDDMREAPSLELVKGLIAAGAEVWAYDPASMEVARGMFPAPWFDSGQLKLGDHQYQVLQEADALVLVTEWKQFRHPDFNAMAKLMKTPVIFDGRNQYNPQQLKNRGFEYRGIGR
ncbi:MAG: UDP-glucose dehydrogenase family protein [Candidatus Competibacterales bacterium]